MATVVGVCVSVCGGEGGTSIGLFRKQANLAFCQRGQDEEERMTTGCVCVCARACVCKCEIK